MEFEDKTVDDLELTEVQEAELHRRMNSSLHRPG
jgi:hypothetical protein